MNKIKRTYKLTDVDSKKRGGNGSAVSDGSEDERRKETEVLVIAIMALRGQTERQ